jgi:uncharacterized protein YndB with AHSA1/START domain
VGDADPVLRKELEVPASVDQVWTAWTTEDGIRSFFAPDAKVELRPGGAYEPYFMLERPEGERGAEGCRVIEVEPPRRLVFSWNFPPHLSTLRNEHTQVRLELQPVAQGTQVALTATGWQRGGQWEEVYAYFERAWGLVLSRLRRRFEHGPVDWSAE